MRRVRPFLECSLSLQRIDRQSKNAPISVICIPLATSNCGVRPSEREDPTDDGEASEHKNDGETDMRQCQDRPVPEPFHSFEGCPRW